MTIDRISSQSLRTTQKKPQVALLSIADAYPPNKQLLAAITQPTKPASSRAARFSQLYQTAFSFSFAPDRIDTDDECTLIRARSTQLPFLLHQNTGSINPGNSRQKCKYSTGKTPSRSRPPSIIAVCESRDTRNRSKK